MFTVKLQRGMNGCTKLEDIPPKTQNINLDVMMDEMLEDHQNR